VAVENYLIVWTPKSGGLEARKGLLRVLNDPRTAALVDEWIMRRHLSASAIKEIPWQM
jgi:hypothetical protein